MGENRASLALRHGNIATASIEAIQRRVLVLENEGATHLFGEPVLDLNDLMRPTADGRRRIDILAENELMGSPGLYATFLLWLLSELFEEFPVVDDPGKPKPVFFFDEAYLLFDEAPKALVEQVVRLIRSKGVGIYFCSAKPCRHS